jgi:dipeptidyl aminopeptidase/acylaminoacyl peptidase
MESPHSSPTPLVRPFFQVHLSSERCAYSVRVNDAPIWVDADANPIDGVLPVSHWMVHGFNVLDVRLSPPPGEARFDERASFRATLTVRTADAPRAADKVITELSFPPPPTETAVPPSSAAEAEPKYFWPDPRATMPLTVRRGDSGPSLGLVRRVALAPSFPRWGWLDAQSLEESEQTFKELLAHYQNFWHDLRDKRLGEVRAALGLRSNEFAAAYYSLPFEMLDDLGIDRSANDPDWILHPLDPHAKLEVFGNQRLARITRWDGEPLLVFVQRDQQLSTYYDLIFCKRNGQWQIIR